MRQSEGFTVVELMVATVLFIFVMGVLYSAYQAETTTFRETKKRMEAINKLWLNMDKIKKDVREGKEFISPSDFSMPIPDNSLVFATNDTTAIAFYTPEDGDLYKAISSSTSTSKVIVLGVSLSSDVTSSVSSAQIILSTSWSYKEKTQQESISSTIHLRNWRK